MSSPPENSQTIDFKEKSHANAKKLLTDDFFWSVGDAYGPVGSDIASDVFLEYWEWRAENGDAPVSEFLMDWLEMLELDPKITRAPIDLTSEKKATIVNKFDDIFIATTFAQFMCDGFLDEDIKTGAMKCLKRQIARDVIEYRGGEVKERSRKLQKMIEAVTQMDARASKN